MKALEYAKKAKNAVETYIEKLKTSKGLQVSRLKDNYILQGIAYHNMGVEYGHLKRYKK